MNTARKASLALAGLAALGLAATHSAQAQTMSTITIINPSFETPDVSGMGGGLEFRPTEAGIGFTFTGDAGISSFGNPNGYEQPGGSGTENAPPPDGNQVGLLVDNTAVISQTLSGFTAGTTYTLSFYASGRGPGYYYGSNPFSVTLDGTPLTATDITPPAGTFQNYQIPFTTTTGSHTLAFNGTGSKASFIDEVQITGVTPAPEPSQTAALGLGVLGLAGLALSARRRQARNA